MAQRGTSARVAFGGVQADVRLYKVSGKPAEAKHDVRWVTDEDRAVPDAEDFAARDAARDALANWAADAGPVGDPFGETPQPPTPPPAPDPEPAPQPPAPQPTARHGAYDPDGAFVDLTEQLAAIDERTRLDAVTVVGTVDRSRVDMLRARDAQWLAAVDPRGAKVLTLLHRALSARRRAAVVKWTVKTRQATGVIVARARGLALVEMEFAENMREPSDAVAGSTGAEVTDRELQAALLLVDRWADPDALRSVRDERTAKRRELLEAARAGKLERYAPPPPPVPAADTDDVADALLSAARS